MSATRDWSRRVVERYEKDLAAGRHDALCEQLPRDGFHLCHCRKRERLARGLTEPPGELIHQYPLCPTCYEETNHDGDSFVCENCHCHWPEAHSMHAEFDDDYGDVAADRRKWLDRKAPR